MRLTFDGPLDVITRDMAAFLDDLQISRAARGAPDAPAEGQTLPPWPGNAQAGPSPTPAPVGPGGAPGAPPCGLHGMTRTYYEPGTNKAGKPYSASWRCDVVGCTEKPVWIADR